jgi:hypothetical protein
MNSHEKKKLRVKYLNKISHTIILAKNQMVRDEELIELLEEINLYVECTDFRRFYEIHQKSKWPSDLNKGELLDNITTFFYSGRKTLRKGSLTELRNMSIQLTREVTLTQLGI